VKQSLDELRTERVDVDGASFSPLTIELKKGGS
jgi:hypothetical protein